MNELVRNLDLRPGNDGIDHIAFELVLDLVCLMFTQPRGDVRAQLLERFKPGRLGGELVVQLG